MFVPGTPRASVPTEATGDSMFAEHAKAPAHRAFTLVELLVVVAIISVLASMLLPALQKSRERARVISCTSVVRSLAIGNSQYAGDNGEFMVHGIDMSYANWGVTANGTRYYGTNIFDDDWGDGGWDGTTMQIGRNVGTGGVQNICGVGQLMIDSYIPSTAEAIGCTEGDNIDQPSYAYGMRTTAFMIQSLKSNWQAEYYTGNPTYAYASSTFAVRGPMLRTFDKPADRTAIFAEHEQATQSIIASVPTNTSPLPYWPRRHKEGLNVAYADGQAVLYKDRDRRITYWTYQARYYGNSFTLQGGGYDNPQ